MSWNEIKHRAPAFGNEWKNETREAAERQSFRNDFFKMLPIYCQRVPAAHQAQRQNTLDGCVISCGQTNPEMRAGLRLLYAKS